MTIRIHLFTQTHHAQSEKLQTAWHYLSRQRGILLVTTFNEGKRVTPRKTEQHVVKPNDGKPVAIAERCELLQREGEDDLYTFVIMTMETNDAVRPVVDEKGRTWSGTRIGPSGWAKSRDFGGTRGTARYPRI
jgi:putative SOS response-associated peptidase YedK